MSKTMVAPSRGSDVRESSTTSIDGIVEIGLFLPAQQARDLIELSRHRGESVAEILRRLIRRELNDDLTTRLS